MNGWMRTRPDEWKKEEEEKQSVVARAHPATVATPAPGRSGLIRRSEHAAGRPTASVGAGSRYGSRPARSRSQLGS